MAAFPTHDDLTLVIAGLRGGAPGSPHRCPRRLPPHPRPGPALGDRVRAGTREERFHAASDLIGYFRKPYGPGWALVGDAGYHLHPITAQGITDAFLDAERLAEALDTYFAETDTYDNALAAYQSARDDHVAPMYEMTFDFAQVDQPPPPETQQLLAAVVGNQQRWTTSSASKPGPCRSRSSSAPTTSAASWPAKESNDDAQPEAGLQ